MARGPHGTHAALIREKRFYNLLLAYLVTPIFYHISRKKDIGKINKIREFLSKKAQKRAKKLFYTAERKIAALIDFFIPK